MHSTMNTGKKGKHIQLPKSLMTEISGISENNENGSLPYSRKRKYQNNAKGRMTRKERRKQERNDKKRKLNNNNLTSPTDDSLDSDDFDEFDEDDLTKEEWKQLRELEGGRASSSSSSSDSSSDDDSEEETFIEETVTKLKPALKQKLNKKVITKTQKKHVTFSKKIHEKLIPARENYGEYDVSSDDDSYLDELDLSDSSDDMSDEGNDGCSEGCQGKQRRGIRV
ncbi:unnamed protein product [Hanseniaspora opuntiae]